MNNAISLSESDFEEFTPGTGVSEPGRFERVMQAVKEFATLAEALRIFGALITIASMSVFLLQGWSDGNDVQRYLKLLAQTGLLAAGGFGLSYLLKEYKGARLFFGLGLISVPVNFTVLGALIYSVFIDSGAAPVYPGFAKWVIADAVSTGLLFGAAMVVLIPVTLLAFRIMARNSSKVLSLTFLGLNGLLVVPTREPLIIGIMAAVALLVVLNTQFQQQKSNPALSTPSGIFATTLLYLPAVLLVARNMLIYGMSETLGLLSCVSAYWVFRKLSERQAQNSVANKILDLLSFPAALGVAFYAVVSWFGRFSDPVFGSNEIDLGIAAAVFSGILVLFMVDKKRTVNPSLVSQLTIPVAALIAALNILVVTVFTDTVLSAILGVLIGTSLTVFGFTYRSRLIAAVGALSIAVASFVGLNDVVVLLFQSSWIGLAVLGGIAIVSASLVDRYGALVRLRLTNWVKAGKERDAEISYSTSVS